MYAKHTVFYDNLPHYFLEFDIYDRKYEKFLDTSSRHAMLSGLPVVSVPLLANASFKKLSDLTRLIKQSNYINEGHIERLEKYYLQTGDDTEKRSIETDPSTLMEGLYVKVEQDGEVVARMKYVRASFLQCLE